MPVSIGTSARWSVPESRDGTMVYAGAQLLCHTVLDRAVHSTRCSAQSTCIQSEATREHWIWQHTPLATGIQQYTLPEAVGEHWMWAYFIGRWHTTVFSDRWLPEGIRVWTCSNEAHTRQDSIPYIMKGIHHD